MKFRHDACSFGLVIQIAHIGNCDTWIFFIEKVVHVITGNTHKLGWSHVVAFPGDVIAGPAGFGAEHLAWINSAPGVITGAVVEMINGLQLRRSKAAVGAGAGWAHGV